MFTGIVKGLCPVVAIEDHDGVRRLRTELGDLAQGLELGASVAHNGVCLTAVAIDGPVADFEVISETLALTNLASIEVGDRVNIERSLTMGDELGGHVLSGHVSATMTVDEIEIDGANRTMWFAVPPAQMPFLLWKGWVAIDGVSLTISRVDRGADRIAVSLIPETLERTRLGSAAVGTVVNLEIDPTTQTIVETVRATLNDPEYRAQLLADEAASSP